MKYSCNSPTWITTNLVRTGHHEDHVMDSAIPAPKSPSPRLPEPRKVPRCGAMGILGANINPAFFKKYSGILHRLNFNCNQSRKVTLSTNLLFPGR